MPYVLEGLSKYILIAHSFTESLLQKDTHIGNNYWDLFYAISNMKRIFTTNEKELPYNY